MSPAREQRIVIAGASSLLGSELKSLLEESRFASWDFSLLDEDTSAGTLTEAGGEATIIQPVEEGSFAHAKFVFFTGSGGFTHRNIGAAHDSGATLIDLSGGALSESKARVWFAIDGIGSELDKSKPLYVVPSAPGLASGRLLDALGRVGLNRLAIVFFRPVSEAGRPGIEELESQTSQLLSFQSVGQPIFDTQVAFNLLDRYGSASRESLAAIRARVTHEVAAAVGRNLVKPSIQVLHAPVFYGYTFVAAAELNSKRTKEELINLLQERKFVIDLDPATPLGNLNASGDSAVHLALPESDDAQTGTWWFWGAADNMRLPASTAIKLAEQLGE